MQGMFRAIRKTLKWAFLLTLPLTFFPLFHGALGGVLWVSWNGNHVWLTTDKWLHEVKHSLSDWGVGEGVMSFNEYQDSPRAFDNPFGVWRINSLDWLRRLGFVLPREYADLPTMEQLDTPIDKYADLTTLMRDVSCAAEAKMPREQWLFLTDYQWMSFDEWNRAFGYVVRYARGDRRLNATGLFYAECARNAGFLCGVWSTRAPALVHFLVEDEPRAPDENGEILTYRASPDALRPVTVRIIEFPLTDAYTGNTGNAILSREEQMLAIMTGDHLYEQFDPYDPMEQMMKRFNEYMGKFGDKKGELLWYLWEVEEWMTRHVTKPLGTDDAMNVVHGLTFTLVAGFLQVFVRWPLMFMKKVVDDFTGKPKRGDLIIGDLGREEEEESLDDILKDLLESLRVKAESISSQSNRQTVSGTNTISPSPITTGI